MLRVSSENTGQFSGAELTWGGQHLRIKQIPSGAVSGEDPNEVLWGFGDVYVQTTESLN